MKPPMEFKVIGDNAVVFHHLYVGLLLIIGSLGQNFMYWIGILIMLDDVVEHWFTADTPLRILFDRVISPMLR